MCDFGLRVMRLIRSMLSHRPEGISLCTQGMVLAYRPLGLSQNSPVLSMAERVVSVSMPYDTSRPTVETSVFLPPSLNGKLGHLLSRGHKIVAHRAERIMYAACAFSLVDSDSFVPIAEDISMLANGILVYYPGPLKGEPWHCDACSE